MSNPPDSGVHLDADRLADLHEGLLDPAAAAAARDHLAACPDCAADLEAITSVPGLLAAAAEVGPVPDDVVRRIDRTLADATAATAPATAARTVTPLRDGARSGPRGMRLLQAAAVIVLLLGGGALAVSAIDSGDNESATSAKSANEAGTPVTKGFPLTASGRDWTKANLASAGPAFATGSLGPSIATFSGRASGSNLDSGGGGNAPSPAAESLVTGRAKRLTDPAALAACARNLVGDDTRPLSVDLAQFEGDPAAVFAFPATGDPSRVDLFVVAPECPTGTFLYYASVPRS